MAINFLSSIDIAGTASLSSVSNDNSSYTGILVWDGGLLKYRTKSQLLTDIGGDINNYVSSISFDTTNGILSLPRTGLSTLTVDLDGRYALESGNVDGSGTTNFVAKWADSNTIQNSIIFDDGTNVRINATNASVNIGTTISTTPTGGHPNTGAGTLIVAGKTNAGYNYQPGVITLINQNPSIAAGADTGVIQFVGKDDATSGYASANIKAFTAAAAGTGYSGGGIITLGTSPGYGGPVERFRINQNGNVGIGTSSPSAPLCFGKTLYGQPSSENFFRIKFEDVGGVNNDTGIGQQASGCMGLNILPTGFLSFNRGTSGEAMRIHTNGNVGIGTASPARKLQVSYSSTTAPGFSIKNTNTTVNNNVVMAFNRDNSDSLGWTQGIDSGDNSFKISEDGDNLETNPRIVILSGGNVGIGTTSPSQKLDVAGNISVYNSYAAGASLFLNHSNQYNSSIIKSIADTIDSQDSGSSMLRFYTNDNSTTSPTVALDLTSESNAIFYGNVGIGTTSPNGNLQLVGAAGQAARFYISDKDEGSAASSSGLLMQSASNTYLYNRNSGSLRLGTNNQSAMMVIAPSGNVGIGTTNPSYKLQVAGGISAGGKATYSKSAGSLDTTGYAVAGLTTASNGGSAGFTFTCFGHTGKYQKIVYSCWNVAGTWNTSKVIDEGTNDFDIEASANGTTITFTFKSRSGSKSYTPKVTVEATGTAINNTYA